MSLAKRAGALAAILTGVAWVLTGCVYLRLYAIKNQLKEFDRYFLLGGRAELVIEFLKPTLSERDTRYLIGADPLEVGESPLRHHYEFELVRRSTEAPPPMARLTLDLVFEQKRLVQLIVPESFMLLFPRQMLIETFKQAKDAEVSQSRRSARGKITLPPMIEDELPSLEKTLLVLGEPLERAASPERTTVHYRYRIVGAASDVPIVARLSFDPSGLLREASVTWDTSTVEAVFFRR